MTAEIAVMNKNGIALAADSAVTIRTGYQSYKTYNSANKLFTLSKFAPVGILVYGAAELNRYPIEVLVKTFREQLGQKTFSNLEEYGRAFFRFLDKRSPISDLDKKSNLLALANLAIMRIYGWADHKRIQANDSSSNFHRHLVQAIADHDKLLTRQGRLPLFKRCSLASLTNMIKPDLAAQHEQIKKQYENLHGKINIITADIEKMETLSTKMVLSKVGLTDGCGIVIAGYGESEYLPSFVLYETDGFLPCGLRLMETITSKVDIDNPCRVNAFAQREMAQVFMEGIDPSYQNFIEKTLLKAPTDWSTIIAKSLGATTTADQKKIQKIIESGMKSALDEMSDFRRDKFVYPVMEALRFLDKSELAPVAESLVALTALKRKMSLSADTVGGPVDVAVISKGDGFIWIKRKFYFEEAHNRPFFAKYLHELDSSSRNTRSRR